jgi:hypothetical protein
LNPIEIREDDLTGAAVRALVAYHLAGARANSPPGYSFALDLSGLQTPDITVWTAWRDHEIAGVGALKAHPNKIGEIKSMRTHPDHLRASAGRFSTTSWGLRGPAATSGSAWRPAAVKPTRRRSRSIARGGL